MIFDNNPAGNYVFQAKTKTVNLYVEFIQS